MGDVVGLTVPCCAVFSTPAKAERCDLIEAMDWLSLDNLSSNTVASRLVGQAGLDLGRFQCFYFKSGLGIIPPY